MKRMKEIRVTTESDRRVVRVMTESERKVECEESKTN